MAASGADDKASQWSESVDFTPPLLAPVLLLSTDPSIPPMAAASPSSVGPCSRNGVVVAGCLSGDPVGTDAAAGKVGTVWLSICSVAGSVSSPAGPPPSVESSLSVIVPNNARSNVLTMSSSSSCSASCCRINEDVSSTDGPATDAPSPTPSTSPCSTALSSATASVIGVAIDGSSSANELRATTFPEASDWSDSSSRTTAAAAFFVSGSVKSTVTTLEASSRRRRRRLAPGVSSGDDPLLGCFVTMTTTASLSLEDDDDEMCSG
ncbi:hypothetical protein H257_09263 [Aphanomyces astaci]|uniref:Uncharacterized protein n=1 Tax=Aphanomyces astaci TaxID=112090 RepID=W4GAW6_APHAT|nr:hypothetical protein H257_09263 [Aphanomyces astaci]ETV76815.1 hypothetical protein H257_09263 [Aphanomyces astaci]|eukprot:XP_009833727.1 hypothetical protein H257_09263 [Aphanomyces astaci]